MKFQKATKEKDRDEKRYDGSVRLDLIIPVPITSKHLRSEINDPEKLIPPYDKNPLYNPKMSYLLETHTLSTLKDEGYLNDRDDVFQYINRMKDFLNLKPVHNKTDWNKLVSYLSKIPRKEFNLQDILDINQRAVDTILNTYKPVKYLEDGSENPIYYLDGNMLTTFMTYESVPKGTRRIGPKGKRFYIYYTPKARIELLDMMLREGYDPRFLPSLNDRVISVGAFQFRRSNYYVLQKKYPELFQKSYEEMITSLEGQALMTAALLYDNMIYFVKNIYSKSDQIKRLFKTASVHEKREFLISVLAAMYNSGPTDVRKVMKKVLTKDHTSLSELRIDFIKTLAESGGKISAPYSEYVGALYFEVERVNSEEEWFRNVISLEPILRPRIEDTLSEGLASARAESDALYIDSSVERSSLPNIESRILEFRPQETQPPSGEESKPVHRPEERVPVAKIGRSGRLLLRKSLGTEYYTFTLPTDLTEEDIKVLLEDPNDLDRIRDFNQESSIPSGKVFYIPKDLIREELRDGRFVVIRVDGRLTPDSLIQITRQYCKGPVIPNSKIIRFYSNITDWDKEQNYVRIPVGLLKKKYLK